MKLMLDYTQRLNLHALIGAQRGSVDDVRFWWRLQDRIELSPEELKAVNYRLAKVNDLEQPVWNVDKEERPREFEFADDEFRRIEQVLKSWQPGFFTSNDRRWLEPLLAQFDTKVSVNGSAEAAIPTGYRA